MGIIDHIAVLMLCACVCLDDFRDEYFDFPCKFHCPQQQFQFVGGVDSPQAKLKVS